MPLKLSAQARERVRQIVLADRDRAESFYQSKIEPMLLHRREIYTADKDYYKRMFPRLTFSDYTSHDMYAWVQWALAQTLDSFFGTQKVISVVGQGQSDADNAETMGQLIKWQIEQANEGFLEFSSWFTDAYVYDLGVLKCWWSRVTQPKEELVNVPQDRLMLLAQTPGVEIVQIGQPDYFGDYPVALRRMVTTDNKPVLDSVSPFDMRWLPEARNLNESLYVAQRQIVTGDVLMRGAKEGVYDKNEARRALDEAGVIDYEEADRVLNPDLENYPTTETEDARKRVELHECYVKIDVDDDGVLEDLIVTLAGDRVLRIEQNPLGRLPFFQISSQHDSARVLPESSMADIEGELQGIRTAMIRQVLMNISTNNKPRTFIDPSKVNLDDVVNDKEFIRVAGQPGQSVQPMPTVPLAPWTMNFIEYFRGVEEEWTGRTRYNQGTDANSLNKTATGISLIMKSSAQRINHIIKTICETGVADLYKFLIRLNQTYIDEAQVIRLLDKPLQIQPDDLEGNFDIVVNADVGLGEKEQTTNVLTSYLREMFPFAMQLGIANPGDFSRAAVRLLELLGWKDARTFLRSPEEIQQMQMQQMLQQQQTMAQQQAMQGQQQMQQQIAAGDPNAMQTAGNAGAQAGIAAAMQQAGMSGPPGMGGGPLG